MNTRPTHEEQDAQNSHMTFAKYLETSSDPFFTTPPNNIETSLTYTISSSTGSLKMTLPHANIAHHNLTNAYFGGAGHRTPEDIAHWNEHGVYPARDVNGVTICVQFTIKTPPPHSKLLYDDMVVSLPAEKVRTLAGLKARTAMVWKEKYDDHGVEDPGRVSNDMVRVAAMEDHGSVKLQMFHDLPDQEAYQAWYERSVVHGRGQWVHVRLFLK